MPQAIKMTKRTLASVLVVPVCVGCLLLVVNVRPRVQNTFVFTTNAQSLRRTGIVEFGWPVAFRIDDFKTSSYLYYPRWSLQRLDSYRILRGSFGTSNTRWSILGAVWDLAFCFAGAFLCFVTSRVMRTRTFSLMNLLATLTAVTIIVAAFNTDNPITSQRPIATSTE